MKSRAGKARQLDRDTEIFGNSMGNLPYKIERVRAIEGAGKRVASFDVKQGRIRIAGCALWRRDDGSYNASGPSFRTAKGRWATAAYFDAAFADELVAVVCARLAMSPHRKRRVHAEASDERRA